MRYLNWDVLLFPGNSRVPLQEFDTKCHVLVDHNNRLVNNPALNSNQYLGEHDAISPVPMLTTFIPSLEPGNSFRVSVHSWEPPKASQILRTFKTPQEHIAYEARIQIDGNMVARRIFDDQTVWPEVVESVGDSESGNSKPLRFPAFHSELLEQTFWDPSEAFGRILIVLAEGVTRQDVNGRLVSAFDRLRDMIILSFQHAPIQILEHSGIAWPNPRMFRQSQRLKNNSIASRVTAGVDFESHAHSPQHRQLQEQFMQRRETRSATLTNLNKPLRESCQFEDPFVDPIPMFFRPKQDDLRRSSTEVSAKDCTSVETANSYPETEMSGISCAKPNFLRSMQEAAVQEIVQALSPERKCDLITALTPDKTSGNNVIKSRISTINPDPYARQKARSGTPLKIPSNPSEHKPRSALRGDLLASKFAPVPILMPSNMTSQNQDPSYGLRSSADPLLPVEWNHAATNAADNGLGLLKALLELRPRSSSDSSKRKREESPGAHTPGGPFKIPSMSTSPCKQVATTPLPLSCETTCEGGAVLDNPE